MKSEFKNIINIFLFPSIPEIKANLGQPNKCERCDKEFTKLVDLELHKSSREYKTPLKICSCKFKSCTLEDMKIHFKMKHSSVVEKTKPIILKSNKETSQQEINIKQRQANGFAGEQKLKLNPGRYKCSYCDNGFERVLDKLRHQKSAHSK